MFKTGGIVRRMQLQTRKILRHFKNLEIQTPQRNKVVRVLRDINILDKQIQNQVACYMEGMYQILLLQERLLISVHNAINSTLDLNDAINLDLTSRVNVNSYTAAGMYVIIDHIMKNIGKLNNIANLDRETLTRMDTLEMDIPMAIVPFAESGFLNVDEAHIVSLHHEEAISIATEFLSKL